MKLDAALDTSATTTAICVVNSRDGSILLETSVTTDPDAIYRVLQPYVSRLHLVGHEATSWSAWLHRELEARGVPMVLLETHHAARMLEAQRNKTDKNDARGLAQLVRSGWFKPVHAKSREANRMKLLLAHRRTLKRKLLDIENEVRQSLKMFGYMVGPRVQRATFPSRIRALVGDDPLLSGATDCMLRCWSVLWDEYRKLHRLLVQLVGRDELCRRWCEIPGGMRVAAKRGHKRAVVAVARKLAVIMHRMWLDGSSFRFAAKEKESGRQAGNTDQALTPAA